jgi:putative tryptophan/tyrosine transport system substrate-binding protein
MKRRAFIAALGGAAAWPMAARALAAGGIVRLGLISGGNPRGGFPWDAFDARLRELGYVEGQNLATEFLNLEGHVERYREVAKELARRNVDIIIASGPEASLKAALAATTTLPIVMIAIDYDPLALAYAASLARPGGNVTGLFLRQIELAAKRVELLQEAFPEQRAAAVFFDRISADQWEATRSAAATTPLRVAGVELSAQPYDYDWALQQVSPEHRRVLIVPTSAIFVRDRVRIAEFALKNRVATMMTVREQVTVGGLMSYGPDINRLFRRAAEYVDRIAKGAKPSDLPIEQPTKFEMIVNLKTAKAIGVTLPTSILLRADEVVE